MGLGCMKGSAKQFDAVRPYGFLGITKMIAYIARHVDFRTLTSYSGMGPEMGLGQKGSCIIRRPSH